jgi:hypothetical protein
MDAALVDSVWEAQSELWDCVAIITYRTPEADRPAAKATLAKEKLPQVIKYLTRILEKNGNKGIFVGDKVSARTVCFLLILFLSAHCTNFPLLRLLMSS